MPYLRIQTNQAVDTNAQQLLLDSASRLVAEQLGKSERYVMVAFESNPAMRFAGDDAPLAYAELKSIGLDEAQTPALSAALCHLMEEQLGVSPQRIYIEFADASRRMWGWNGGTF
jgi:phenylpyruvate tautomerase PptA (4-oxalocrotonate tautomerase family)